MFPHLEESPDLPAGGALIRPAKCLFFIFFPVCTILAAFSHLNHRRDNAAVRRPFVPEEALLAGALSLRHIIGQIFPLNCLAHLPRGIDIAHLSGIPHLTVTFLDGITCRLLHLFVILTGAQRS